MQGELTSEEIDSLLQTENYGRLACSADGRPYIVPVGFAYDGKRFICYGAEGLKIEMMRKNPEVCFQVDNIENLVNWKSVVAWGKFVKLSGTEASTSARLIIDKLFSALDYPTMPSEGMRSITPPSRSPDFTKAVVYQIEIAQKTGRTNAFPCQASESFLASQAAALSRTFLCSSRLAIIYESASNTARHKASLHAIMARES